jgi:metallo-beta-lactamase family protein
MLFDSARIQQEDEQFMLRHKLKNPLQQKAPLYTAIDVENTLKLFSGKQYGQPFAVTDDVTVEFLDAGHVFGSSIVLLTIDTPQGKEKIVFTGDLGRSGMPIIQDPEYVPEAEYLIIESTYGGRKHERVDEIEQDLADIVNKTVKRGGKIFIPAFALERTQELILRLENLIHHGKIPHLKIYVDSPLADKITKVFEEHPEYYDDELLERHEKRRKIFSFPNLVFTQSVEESKGLNHVNVPCIIISGSGMAESGRIRHHLKNNIEDSKHSVLIVGYQAEETLGRKLVEGQKTISIFGNDYAVRSEVVVFKSLSAHADQDGLDHYVKSIKGLKKIFIVHGENESRQAFSERISLFYPSAEVILPEPGKTYSLERSEEKIPQQA